MVTLGCTKNLDPVIFFGMDEIVESLADITLNPDDPSSESPVNIDTQLLTYIPEVLIIFFFVKSHYLYCIELIRPYFISY